MRTRSATRSILWLPYAVPEGFRRYFKSINAEYAEDMNAQARRVTESQLRSAVKFFSEQQQPERGLHPAQRGLA